MDKTTNLRPGQRSATAAKIAMPKSNEIRVKAMRARVAAAGGSHLGVRRLIQANRGDDAQCQTDFEEVPGWRPKQVVNGDMKQEEVNRGSPAKRHQQGDDRGGTPEFQLAASCPPGG